MLDTIKKTILTGVGAAVVTREKVQEAFNDLVAQGKVTAADALAMADKISADGKREFESASEKASHQVHHLLNKSAEATHQRLSELETRLKALEARGRAQVHKATKPVRKAPKAPKAKAKVQKKKAR